jgi:hypothetical protein
VKVCCEHNNEPSVSIKYSWIAAWLAASQDGLGLFEIVLNLLQFITLSLGTCVLWRMVYRQDWFSFFCKYPASCRPWSLPVGSSHPLPECCEASHKHLRVIPDFLPCHFTYTYVYTNKELVERDLTFKSGNYEDYCSCGVIPCNLVESYQGFS